MLSHGAKNRTSHFQKKKKRLLVMIGYSEIQKIYNRLHVHLKLFTEIKS